MSWVEDNYAGRRHFLRHLGALYHIYTGGWRTERAITWSNVKRLAFVCAGNICRSPYAEARSRQLGLQAISSGLTARPGAVADPSAQRNAISRGIDMTSHRSQLFAGLQLGEADLVIMFEPTHLEEVSERVRDANAQVTLLGLWAPSRRPYVADPYGKGDPYFQTCFQLIDNALHEVKSLLSNEEDQCASPETAGS